MSTDKPLPHSSLSLSILIQWADNKIKHSDNLNNAMAIESEFFEWFDDIHKGNRSNVIFLPHLKSLN